MGEGSGSDNVLGKDKISVLSTSLDLNMRIAFAKAHLAACPWCGSGHVTAKEAPAAKEAPTTEEAPTAKEAPMPEEARGQPAGRRIIRMKEY